ncbi:excinuclease ATPase subunit [Lampropedia puyangensis]|uniref:Excinuclease ATPase subunit n=1 Tax=Lampropedia puyangensis TaxID=1330072 RepID=A0A4S8FAI4_9BURK|nr:excinuclease ATPase subunit [Lampropedia puyangensis]THU02592.1 excinuclease ATPase subunit [Lampropedia puyangensis]
MNHSLSHILLSTTLCTTALFSSTAFARDTANHFPFADVIALGQAEGKLDGSVQFFLKGQNTPAISQRLSTDSTNKKTNGVGKSDEVACQWVALSALIALQDKAKSLGANAVVDIVSNYKKIEYASPTNYECHSGAIMSGVALKGTYAKTR